MSSLYCSRNHDIIFKQALLQSLWNPVKAETFQYELAAYAFQNDGTEDELNIEAFKSG